MLRKASPTGGPEVSATQPVRTIITKPRTTTRRSTAAPARLTRKIPMAMAAETVAPILTSSPSMASVPRPVPEMLPMLKTIPPMTTRAAST